MRACALILAVMAGACSRSNTVRCGDVTCPAGSTCSAENLCIPADCGDSVVTGIEACDTTVELECTDVGYYSGELACSAVCELDESACAGQCGDHVINGPENCDGIPPAGYSCADFGFDVGPLTCSTACTPGFEACSAIGWKTSPGGGMNELHGVWASGPRTGYAVGFGGTILRATDGVWTPIASPTTDHLYAVYGVPALSSTPDRAIAVGAGGRILALTGTSWTVMPSPTSSTLFAVAGTGPQNIIAVGAGGTIVRFDGTTWSAMTSPTAENLNGVWVGPSRAYAVGDNNTLLQLESGSWSVLPLSTGSVHLRAVHSVDGQLFITGDGSTVLRTTGTGPLTPLPLPAGAPPSASLTAVWGSASGDVFIAGALGVLFHWDGRGLAQMSSPTSRTIYDLDGVGNRAFGVARGGGVIEYSGIDRRTEQLASDVELHAVAVDGGATLVAGASGYIARHTPALGWQSSLVVASDRDVRALLAFGATVYAGTTGATSGIYRSTNGGASFETSPVATAGVNAMFALSPSDGYAVGDTIQRLTAAGWAADSRTAPVNMPTLFGVWATSDGQWFAVGDGGYAIRSTATGWEPIPTGLPANIRLQAVWGTSASDVFAVGESGVVVHWDGARWRALHVATGENLLAVSGTGHGNVFAGGTNGALFHFDGISWSRVSRGAFDIWSFSPSVRELVSAGSQGHVERLVLSLSSSEERCKDPWDNDGDGAINCADDDCRDDLGCNRGGACETAARIDCTTSGLATSTYSGSARIDDLPCLDHSTAGPEASHRFHAEASGPVTITIEDPTGTLDVVVMPSVREDLPGGACDVTTCTAGTGSGGTKSVTFDATAGRVYHVLVDGPLYRAEPFTLSVSCL